MSERTIGWLNGRMIVQEFTLSCRSSYIVACRITELLLNVHTHSLAFKHTMHTLAHVFTYTHTTLHARMHIYKQCWVVGVPAVRCGAALPRTCAAHRLQGRPLHGACDSHMPLHAYVCKYGCVHAFMCACMSV